MKHIMMLMVLALPLVGCGPGVSDHFINLGNGYQFHHDSPMDGFIAPKSWNDQTPIIPTKVVLFIRQGDFVTAKREIIEIDTSESRVRSGKFDYWILNTAAPKVLGPFDKEQLIGQLDALDLPHQLIPE